MFSAVKLRRWQFNPSDVFLCNIAHSLLLIRFFSLPCLIGFLADYRWWASIKKVKLWFKHISFLHVFYSTLYVALTVLYKLRRSMEILRHGKVKYWCVLSYKVEMIEPSCTKPSKAKIRIADLRLINTLFNMWPGSCVGKVFYSYNREMIDIGNLLLKSSARRHHSMSVSIVYTFHDLFSQLW